MALSNIFGWDKKDGEQTSAACGTDVEQEMHQQRSRQHAAQLAEHLTSKKEMCQVFYENLTCSVSPCRRQLQMG